MRLRTLQLPDEVADGVVVRARFVYVLDGVTDDQVSLLKGIPPESWRTGGAEGLFIFHDQIDFGPGGNPWQT